MNRSVLITGADHGLGYALVEAFLASNFTVFAGQYIDESPLTNLELRRPQNLYIIPLDVTQLFSVENAAQRVAGITNQLDILINNAGIHLENSRKPLEEADLEAMTAMFQLNSMGPLRVTRAFLPLLRRGDLKRIINISSEAGSITNCNWRKSEFGYSMSKAALNMQTKLLHNYLAPEGFKLLVVHPGWMRTQMGGAQADIDAKEAAVGIQRLTLSDALNGEDIFLDYLGNPLPW